MGKKLIPPTSKQRRERKLRAEVRTLNRAVDEAWPIPKDARPAIIERLKTVVARKGPDTDPNAVRAAQVLASMDATNQRDYWNADKNTRLDTGKATDRVALEPVTLVKAI